ncbi:unnamed protein product [Urochloa humidicola]
MAPRNRKRVSKCSTFVPFGCCRIYYLFKQARRARETTLVALMKELKRIRKKKHYDASIPTIVRWEQYLPFGGGVLRGARSSKDYTKSWTCLCGVENVPSRRRLFDIPALQCRSCGNKADVEFDFVYDKTMLNGIPTIRGIKYQENGYCGPYAFTAAAEIDQAIKAALEGKTTSEFIALPLDADNLVNNHKRHRKTILQEKKMMKKKKVYMNIGDEFNKESLELLGAIAKVSGIRQKNFHDQRHRIASCKRLDRDDFVEICTAIADGPVVAVFDTGKDLEFLSYGQVYSAPGPHKFLAKDVEHVSHAVVLVGAGRREGHEYFYFLNSWGTGFCCRFTDQGRLVPGGIGIIRASDIITDPIHLRRKAT